MSGTDPGCAATRLLSTQPQLEFRVRISAISLRACYGMSGTDIRCGAVFLRQCYAMSGTGVGHSRQY
eukprot:998646-Rhodomonas_salina.6